LHLKIGLPPVLKAGSSGIQKVTFLSNEYSIKNVKLKLSNSITLFDLKKLQDLLIDLEKFLTLEILIHNARMNINQFSNKNIPYSAYEQKVLNRIFLKIEL
jgi:hypothetical protein